MSYRILICLTACLLAGCGSGGPELAEVKGRVTYDGKAVPKATVEFVPTAEGGSPSLAKTDKDGNYRLEFSQDRFGALLGNHDVMITAKKPSKDELPDDGSAADENMVELPKNFAKKGTLTAEVKSGSNTIDFPLTSK